MFSKYQCLLYFILFQISCNIKPKVVNSISDSVGQNKNIRNDGVYSKLYTPESYDSIISDIDNLCLRSKPESVDLKGIFHDNDTLTLTLFRYNNEIPAKLIYPIYDDIGVQNGVGSYFFDSQGNLIGNRIGNFYTIFSTSDSVFLFEKDDSKFKINQIDHISRLSKLSIAAKDLASMLQFFNNIKFNTIKTSENSLPILKVKDISIPLKEGPSVNTRTVATLKPETHLIYLEATSRSEYIDGKRWIWYKVMAGKEGKGWVFGHPSLIEDLNDEND